MNKRKAPARPFGASSSGDIGKGQMGSALYMYIISIALLQCNTHASISVASVIVISICIISIMIIVVIVSIVVIANGVSTDGVTPNVMFFDRVTFWVLPLTYFDVSKFINFAAAPLVLTPFVRNQDAQPQTFSNLVSLV